MGNKLAKVFAQVSMIELTSYYSDIVCPNINAETCSNSRPCVISLMENFHIKREHWILCGIYVYRPS